MNTVNAALAPCPVMRHSSSMPCCRPNPCFREIVCDGRLSGKEIKGEEEGWRREEGWEIRERESVRGGRSSSRPEEEKKEELAGDR